MYWNSSKGFPRIKSYWSEKFWKLFIITHRKAWYKHLPMLVQMKYDLSFNQLCFPCGSVIKEPAWGCEESDKTNWALTVKLVTPMAGKPRYLFLSLPSPSSILSRCSSIFSLLFSLASLVLVPCCWRWVHALRFLPILEENGFVGWRWEPDLINNLQDPSAVNNSIISEGHSSNSHSF